MSLEEVNEGTTSYLTVSFLDKSGAAAAPASARCRIDCLTSGQVIRAWTALTPGTSIEITITAAENALNNDASEYETRLVTTEGTYSSTEKVTDEYQYRLINLTKYPATS
jgi:hypothetical protein